MEQLRREIEMDKKVKCSCCGTMVGKLELFPNDMCLSCYEMEQYAREKAIGTARYMNELYADIMVGFGGNKKGKR